MRELVDGLRYLGKGQRWVARHGRWWGFGLLPGIVALVLYVAAIAALFVWGGDLAAWATPFADDWSAGWREALRWTVTVLMIGGGLLLSVLTFTAVTLIIGQPFYESLAEQVEKAEGRAPAPPDRSLWAELVLGVREAVTLLLRVAVLGIVLFALGFVPVLGQTAVPVVGFGVSGFFLAEELTSVALQRRDVRVRERLRMLRGHLPLALGFGVPLTLLFLVPFVAVLMMPGAVAGATLLVREKLAPLPDGPEPADEEDFTPAGPAFAHGRDADVYPVRNPSRVLRRYRRPSDTGPEAAAMALAAAHGVPVPAVHGARGADLVMERLDGVTMAEAFARGEATIPQGAEILADLHRRLDAVPLPDGTPAAAPGDRLVHLDLHPENVLLTSRGPVLIDWRNATVGPAGLDVAVSALILAEVVLTPGHPQAEGARALLFAFCAHAPADPSPYLDRVAAMRAGYPTTTDGERARHAQAVALVRAARAAVTP